MLTTKSKVGAAVMVFAKGASEELAEDALADIIVEFTSLFPPPAS